MHEVILLAIFVEAGVKVHESEVTFVEQNLTRMRNELWNAYMVEMGQYYDMYIMIHNAAILTLQIPTDSMHHCASITTVFSQMHA